MVEMAVFRLYIVLYRNGVFASHFSAGFITAATFAVFREGYRILLAKIPTVHRMID